MKKQYMWVIGVLVLFGFIFAYWSISTRAFSAENALEAAYQRGFYNLIDQVNDLNLLISKSEVTSSDEQRIMLLTTIWHQAEGARVSLGTMPLGDRDITNTQKYFAQMGDFSYQLCNKLINKKSISQEEWDKMEIFRKNTQALGRELRNLQRDVAAGKISWEPRKNRLKIAKKLHQGIADGFEKVDEKLKNEAPTITYDGPFSDHVENIKPKGLTGEKITRDEAKILAKDFASKSTKNKLQVREIGRVQGNIPGYSFELMKSEGSLPELVMDISETGGHVVWFLNMRDVDQEAISIEEAVKNAERFLKDVGYENMIPTGSLRENTSLTITFVPKIKETLLYPDFVKVEVALDNGQIIGMDAVAYLTNHSDRDLVETELSREDAIEKINKNLEVTRIRKALIPDTASNEILCYEVDVLLDDERFFIYINAENGNEERILKVVETDKGTMTM